MALHLLLKWKPNSHVLKNTSILHFSTTDSKGKPQTPAVTEDTDVPSSSELATTTQLGSSFSSYLSELSANHKNKQQQPQPNSQSSQFRRPTPFFTSTSGPQNKSAPNHEEIRKKLSNFRHPSAEATGGSEAESSSTSASPSLPNIPQHISFQELYQRNASRKSDVSIGNAEVTPGKEGRPSSFAFIRDSLRNTQFRHQNAGRNVTGHQSSSSFQNILKPLDFGKDSKVIGGKDSLPKPIFVREMTERNEGYKSLRMDLLGMHSFESMGQRLKELRPEVKEGNWFSLQELRERLSKLRTIEEEEAMASNNEALKLKKTLLTAMIDTPADRSKKSVLQRFNLPSLTDRGRTPDYMLKPPKEHLVEKYFHPDNMSSAEKLKIELSKVRDEFKMSESDCGSARVQVALLTTKIKHLSSVLHKKDKHSRKGLEEMVQKRKKLLKYLRKTDWDSYCLVISKLGLRDNPISKA